MGAVLTRQHPFISDMVSKGPGNQGRRELLHRGGAGTLRPSQPCSWHTTEFQGWELSEGFPV